MNSDLNAKVKHFECFVDICIQSVQSAEPVRLSSWRDLTSNDVTWRHMTRHLTSSDVKWRQLMQITSDDARFYFCIFFFLYEIISQKISLQFFQYFITTVNLFNQALGQKSKFLVRYLGMAPGYKNRNEIDFFSIW